MQISLLLAFIIGSAGTILLLFLQGIIPFPTSVEDILLWFIFIVAWIGVVNEGYFWAKNGKRSEWGDFVIIGFLFILVYLFTRDILNSFIGAFSIYLIIGIFELKDYEVVYQILLITVITYNFIFFAGLLDAYYAKEGLWRDTAFSLSFWLMLGLGFAFFGRKYIIVWRFMSPQYLTLALYLVAWLGISTVTKFTSYNVMNNIYEVLIITNLIIYAFTGPLLDIMLGMKPVDDPKLNRIIMEVAPKVGLDPAKIKIRFGQYPILNAMAYGAWWDMRMGIIAPDINNIAEDELKGIVAHELAHLRGKHTLSLTVISIGELVMRKILDWPATYYDYVFAPEDQPYSMFWFIVINTLLYFFIYIFVRMFEAQADLNTKRAGFGVHLAKGLYNLESFYSYGREIGLNTMLLCEEKITEENRRMDYLTTAQYLNKMIINPSRGGLISNFLNSHPPSYHRIIASLHSEEISIAREAIMPITFLSKKTAHKFLIETQEARIQALEIMTKKMKDEFHIDTVPNLMQAIKKRELLEHKLGKTYIFTNMMTLEMHFAELVDIQFQDNASEPILYHIELKGKESGKKVINSALYSEKQVTIFEDYYFKDEGVLKLKEVLVDEYYSDPKSKKDLHSLSEVDKIKVKGILIFTPVTQNGEEGKQIKKPALGTRIPRSLQSLKSFQEKTIFIKERGSYIPHEIKEISINPPSREFTLSIIKIQDTIEKPEPITIKSNDYVFKFGQLFIPIHNDEHTKITERKIISFLKKKQKRIVFLLKKAVNNEEDGYIDEIEEKNGSIDKIHIITIYKEHKMVEFKKIDALIIETMSISSELKENVSSTSMMINSIIAKFHPDEIII